MSKFIETRRTLGPRHVAGYLSPWIVRGIFERRDIDPNAAACVAFWRAEGILAPEPEADPLGEGGAVENVAQRMAR